MSWSATYKYNPEDGLVRTVISPDMSDGAKEQHDVALIAATDALSTNAVGTEEKSYLITVSGHANENHEPASGWSNDFISINISQLDSI